MGCHRNLALDWNTLARVATLVESAVTTNNQKTFTTTRAYAHVGGKKWTGGHMESTDSTRV